MIREARDPDEGALEHACKPWCYNTSNVPNALNRFNPLNALPAMKPIIYLGADHAGFDMKTSIKEHLEAKGYSVEDLGAHELDPADDYPQYAEAVAEAVLNHPGSVGVLSCGNAEGVTIVANKFEGIRAGLAYSIEAAKTMRNDDNANIMSIPGRLDIPDDPLAIVDTFLETDFSEADRHVRRLGQVEEIEAEN